MERAVNICEKIETDHSLCFVFWRRSSHEYVMVLASNYGFSFLQSSESSCSFEY
jgi:hypothetical protein